MDATLGSQADDSVQTLLESSTCFGFSVESELKFQFARSGAGLPLAVRESETEEEEPAGQPLIEWAGPPENPIKARLRSAGDGYSLWIDTGDWFRIDPSTPSITVSRTDDVARREARLWGVPMALCSLHRGDLPIHGAAVDVNGSGLILAAPGKFGKTTLAAAFLQAGYRLLSEDLSCCRLSPFPALLPGPALLRLRRDVYERMELPGTRTVAESPGRILVSIAESRRGNGLPVPLKGIVLLRETDGETRLDRCGVEESLRDLWWLTLKTTERDLPRCFQLSVDLAGAVPIWNLQRRLRFDALPEVVNTIVTTCLE